MKDNKKDECAAWHEGNNPEDIQIRVTRQYCENSLFQDTERLDKTALEGSEAWLISPLY